MRIVKIILNTELCNLIKSETFVCLERYEVKLMWSFLQLRIITHGCLSWIESSCNVVCLVRGRWKRLQNIIRGTFFLKLLPAYCIFLSLSLTLFASQLYAWTFVSFHIYFSSYCRGVKTRFSLHSHKTTFFKLSVAKVSNIIHFAKIIFFASIRILILETWYCTVSSGLTFCNWGIAVGKKWKDIYRILCLRVSNWDFIF